MAQPGNFTPILLYGSSTVAAVPLAANLTNSGTGSEIAINVADKNLFFKDSGGVVNTVPIRQSSISSNGWLSSTDWNTFNGKAPATSGTSLLYGNGSGGFSNVTIGTGITFAGGTLSATGSGGTVTSVTGTAPVVSSGGNTPAISMAAANTTTNGYLTSTDWTTFNNKGSGTVTSVAALTLGTTGTDLSSTVATGTTTPVITLNVPTASATNRGALSSTDWSTFNGKQAALVSGTNIKTVGGVSLLGSGDVGTIGVGYGGTGLTTLTAGYIPYGNGASAFSSSSSLYFSGTNLGINTTSPTARLQVFTDGAPAASGNMNTGVVVGSGTGSFAINMGSHSVGGYTWLNSAYINASGTASPMVFMTGATERMRIDTSGNLLVNTTSTVVGGKLSVSVDGTPGGFACSSASGGVVLDLNRTGSTSGDVVYIRTSGGTLAGYITCPTSNTTSYLSISDYRLKTDIEPLTGALDRVMQLKPCIYTWKANNIKSEGFIAHELQSVVPEAVGGIKDAVNEDGSPRYQGVDAGSASLIAVLSAALQELNNKFDAYVASHP